VVVHLPRPRLSRRNPPDPAQRGSLEGLTETFSVCHDLLASPPRLDRVACLENTGRNNGTAFTLQLLSENITPTDNTARDNIAGVFIVIQSSSTTLTRLVYVGAWEGDSPAFLWLERISKRLSHPGRGWERGEIRGKQALTPALAQREREVLKCALVKHGKKLGARPRA
jgi:hypothetical protein